METSSIVPNFRDVGETVNNLLGDTLLKECTLYRGGKLSEIQKLSDIKNPKTIINLRRSFDPEFPEARNYHFPAPDSVDVYEVERGANRKWILQILKTLTSGLSTPIYLHCAAGKDRTGVMVAAILSVIGIDRQTIMQDYELSEGLLHPDLFSSTLDSFADSDYFKKVDIEALSSLFRA